MTNAAFLADLTVRATAVLLAAMVLAWSFRRRSAAVRHVLWVAAFAGLLALPVLSLNLPAWRVLPALRHQAAQESAVVNEATAPIVVLEQLPPPTEELDPIGATFPASAPVFTPPAVRTSPTADSQRWPEIQKVLLSLWATGFIVFLTRIAVSHYWMRSAIRSADVSRSGPLRAALDQLTQEFGWKRRVNLVVTRTETMPMACGLITPTILLPPQSKDWTRAQGRSVLLHEFGHILRRDPLWKLVIELGRAVYWFHPLTWLAARWAAADRERACDDLVLRSGVAAAEYARHLLDVVSGGRLSRFQPSAGVAMASTRRLDRRLRSLMRPTQDRRPLRRLAVAATLVAGSCLLVPIAVVRPSEPPPLENLPAERERGADDAGDAQGNSGRWWSSGFLPGARGDAPIPNGNSPEVPNEVRRETLEWLKALNEQNVNDPDTETRIQQYERAFRRQAELAGLSQASDPSDVWDVRLLAVDERTGAPISNPQFIVQLSGDRWTEHAGNENGEFVAKFATRTPRYCYLKVRADGYAAMQGFWSNYDNQPRDELPEQVVFEMEPSITVGGVIVDEAGEPVEGATVYFGAANDSRNEGRRIKQQFWREPAVTDAEGRWQCDLAPPGVDSASFRVEHPEFVQPDPDMNFGLDDEIPELKDQTHVWRLKRGFVIRGRVVDGNGLPIEGAVLAVGELNIYRRNVIARTDADGRYAFPRVAALHSEDDPGESHEMTITAMKPGLAPAMEMVPGFGGLELGASTVESRVVDLALGSGREIGFEFRDSDGNPVRDVRVRFREWRDTDPFSVLQQFGIPQNADADGNWTWDWAPAGEIEYQFTAPGFRNQNLRVSAAGNTREVVLEREQVIKGRVVDADTGEPIPLFDIEAGYRNTRYHPVFERFIVWMSSHGTRGVDGEYRLNVDWAGDTLYYRAVAEGYEPAQSGAVTVKEGEVTLDFELRRSEAEEESADMSQFDIGAVDATLLAQAEGCLTRRYLILEALAKQDRAALLESSLQAAATR